MNILFNIVNAANIKTTQILTNLTYYFQNGLNLEHSVEKRSAEFGRRLTAAEAKAAKEEEISRRLLKIIIDEDEDGQDEEEDGDVRNDEDEDYYEVVCLVLDH